MTKFKNAASTIAVLKEKISNQGTDSLEDFLGFYHENDINTIELLYLEEKGCEIYGKTLEEIRALGPAFLAEIMHPEDIERCVNLLTEFAKKGSEEETLIYNQRLKMVGDEDYKTYFTCVKADFTKSVFQAVTTAMTQIDDFYLEVNTVLESSKYIEENVSFYTSFSKREKEIIKWVCNGKNVNEIADILFLSHHTVIKHKKNIYKKAGFDSKIQLIEFALNFNLI
ncbi:LuxR C-terminal-related transcriptional regulator [Aquimarina agarilytica]|uniref:LuxR C-terminal-related transcriptional regulator n=1 Tax=Aquimarina agarilytica TaxID=1087449 RepID=UPI000287B722|nr:LuxR C-terminal-related transcriptional regulator [Aquimarina agarilytica]